MTRICTICARGGSKGIPGKNLRPLGGRPLIAWSVAAARACGLFDLIAVSSDSAAIRQAGIEAGAGLAIDRPAEMATDTAGKVPAIRHALLAAEAHLGRRASVLVDLSATAPLRLPEDIAGAVALQAATGATSVITGMPAKCSPYFSLVEQRPDGSVGVAKTPDRPILRRQDAPACFDMNGSIYVWARDPFVDAPQVFYPDTRLFEMPEERSVDIDSPLDFRLAELLVAEQPPLP